MKEWETVWVYNIVRFFIRIYAALMWKIHIEGLENLPAEGSVVLCANHRSNWDPIALVSVSPRQLHLMGKEELFENPILRWILSTGGMVRVKRGTTDRKAIREMLAFLQQGAACGLFPEGTRSPEGELKAFYQGAMYFAFKTGAPVVPVALKGNYAWRQPLHICFGTALQPGQSDDPDREELHRWTAKLGEAIAAMFHGEEIPSEGVEAE